MIEPWQALATTDFAALDPARTVVLLPVAAIEQHGPHLPLGTDRFIVDGVIDAAGTHLADTTRVLRLPTQAIGDSLEHSAFPGTLSQAPEALLAQWSALGASVARAGLRKLVILNGHGGQTGSVDQVALRLRAQHRLLVVRAHTFALGMPEGLFDPAEVADGLHGGEVETALMLHLHPELVRRDALRDFSAPAATPGGLLGPERPVGFAWMSQDLNPAGAIGNAARADAARGARLLAFLGQRLAALLEETAAARDLLRDAPG